MKKRIISLVLVLLMLSSISICAAADSKINEARQGVVKITESIYINSALAQRAGGTGFFVGNFDSKVQYLVTNYHVVENYVNLGQGQQIRSVDDYGNKAYVQVVLNVIFDENTNVEAYLVDYDESQDIAVLKLDKATDARKALPLKIPTDNMVGDSMYVVGYPGSNQWLDTTTAWDIEDSIVAKGTLGRLVTESATGDKWIGSTDIDIHHGNSGGPVLEENGGVIGVACWGYNEYVDSYESINFVVNIESVVEILRRNDVPYVMADEQAYEPTTAPVQTEAPAPVQTEAPAPVQTEAPAPVQTEAPAPVVENKDKISPVVIAAVAVAAVAVIALVVVLSKSKKTKASAQEIQKTAPVVSPMQTTAPVKKFNPVLRSLAPQHNKQKVAIKSAPIVIGRTKDCDIIYKDGTPGVSGKHCTVSWDERNSVFVLKDMNSTYGTFLDSGMKLEPNRDYSLKAGETFYIGDKENTLRVELE